MKAAAKTMRLPIPSPSIPSIAVGVLSVVLLQIGEGLHAIPQSYVNWGAYISLVLFIWRVSSKLNDLTQFMLIYRIEHDELMSEWEKRTGQTRPARALANAKQVGM